MAGINISRMRPGAARPALSMILFAYVVFTGHARSEPAKDCDAKTPQAIYQAMKDKTNARKSYTATYHHSTYRGENREVYSKMRVTGKYIKSPALYWEKRLLVEASFPEQAGKGYQQCYSGAEDLTEVLMPGALRGLGVITMFPEDPKAYYINGENLKHKAIWNWLDKWDRMKRGGAMSATCQDLDGEIFWLLDIRGGPNSGPLYHHIRARIWVVQRFHFPRKFEVYAEGIKAPVIEYEFEEYALDAALAVKDVSFEGPAPGWQLVSPPGGKRLDGLKQEDPEFEGRQGPDKKAFVKMLDQALAQVKDYRTDMTVTLRYHRLRQYRESEFKGLNSGAFSNLIVHLEANYILLNAGEGFRIWRDPSRDGLLHVIPAGVYRVMGEQTFPLDDPRLFSPLGDNVTKLSFFAIRDELKARMKNARPIKTAYASHGESRGPWIEVTDKDPGAFMRPRVMRLLLDVRSHLPVRLDYRGYGDPHAFLTVKFENTGLNFKMKGSDFWK